MTLDLSLAPNRNVACAGALVDELARAGVRHFVVSPGSRSTPLVAALVALSRAGAGIELWSLIDERCAGFFALGLAKQGRAPAALVCTSGTAAANLFPAVVEASQSGVPLIVLSADRPPELRDWSAPQTIDQLRLYGPYARWFAEMPPPEAGAALVRHARALGARAVAAACGRPPGPVHVNLPFREPLEPVALAGDGCDALAGDPLAARGRSAGSYTRVETAPAAPPEALVRRLAAAVSAAARGVIAAGPLDAPASLAPAVTRLARAARWPVLAEPTSQLRWGAHAAGAPLAGAYDLFLRNESLARSLAPEIVLRLGTPLTSKAFAIWLASHPAAELWLVDSEGRFADPTHRAAEVLRFDPERLCAALAAELERTPPPRDGAWPRALADANARARRALEAGLGDSDFLSGPRVAAELADALPSGATLFVSNSLPIRDVDAVFPVSPKPLRVLCNRGANGIDGIVSTALGAAAAGASPLVLFTGDLALLHDLGGLLVAKRARLSATIVVLQNDGGGIFSALPVAAHREAVGFDALFTTPHGLELARVAALFEASHSRAASPEELRLALKQSIGAPGLHLIEVPQEREADVAARRALFARAAQAAAP
ncbi:MAG TPA: 2-succinyl-5-enolpyruvyl-6-hydroxy-3-cyclohexene-1-carboxylic-acid synthase [Myxococcota bacterium]|nr:2-succinyl-5-enolpyruvyl-6-hydroxy-3-cyclohexene-1-carboxylic-acid synthase [Myxococcota bacterium]